MLFKILSLQILGSKIVHLRSMMRLFSVWLRPLRGNECAEGCYFVDSVVDVFSSVVFVSYRCCRLRDCLGGTSAECKAA